MMLERPKSAILTLRFSSRRRLRVEHVSMEGKEDEGRKVESEDPLLRFQIPVHDVVTVTVLQRAHDLLEEPPRLVLGHLSPSDDVVEKLAGEVLDDHNNVGGRGDDVVAV
jgi:hypothetical protein